MRSKLWRLAGFVVFLLTGGVAGAQQERVASNGPWNAQCRTDRIDGKVCEVQTVYDVRKALLANYWLTYALKEKTFSINGAPCPASGRVWVDKQPAAAFESCSKCACQMKAEDSSRLFDLARTGKTLFVEIKDSKGVVAGPFETRLREFEKIYRAAAALNAMGK